MRWTHIPSHIDTYLRSEWSKLSEKEKANCAQSIVELSRFFQGHDGPETPWKFIEAYKFYFLPLNLARASAVLESLKQILIEPVDQVLDFGAGLGNFLLLKDQLPIFKNSKIFVLEQDRQIQKQRQELIKTLTGAYKAQDIHSLSEMPPNPKTLAFFSYSWLEMKISAHTLKNFEHLIFLEPSTMELSRSLMKFRQDLMEVGFHPLAPCTHSKPCPLLTHSKTDWCHDRVHFEKSDWFKDLENQLPMKNQTLTFSYLVMSKTPTEKVRGLTRVIGDTLKEKGKVKQAICFDDQRRFLSWLKRDNPNPEVLDHGSLVKIEEAQIAGNEIRSKKITHIP